MIIINFFKWAKIITIKITKDLNYFSLCALHLFNTRVSQYELNYWNKWTFPRHSNLFRCTCRALLVSRWSSACGHSTERSRIITAPLVDHSPEGREGGGGGHPVSVKCTLLFQSAVCHRGFPALLGPGTQGTCKSLWRLRLETNVLRTLDDMLIKCSVFVVFEEFSKNYCCFCCNDNHCS